VNTDGEVLLSNIVLEEFSNFYKTQLKQKTNLLLKANNDLERDPYFHTNILDDIKVAAEYQKAVNKFRDTLRNDPVTGYGTATLQPTMIDGLELTKFILESKETKESNVQIRDYLIWDSVLNFARKQSVDQVTYSGKRKIIFKKSMVTFISKDKGFEKNELFQHLKNRYDIDNIEVEGSITSFLQKKGFYFDFITARMIELKITPTRILKDLSKDIGVLLSYVSKRYYHNWFEKDIVNSEIEKVEVLEHFTYLDSEVNRYKFTANLKVWVKVVFERDEEGYKESLETLNLDKDVFGGNLETYDELQRPYFRKPILFYYGGLVNIEKKSIVSVQFLDYMPFAYL